MVFDKLFMSILAIGAVFAIFFSIFSVIAFLATKDLFTFISIISM